MTTKGFFGTNTKGSFVREESKFRNWIEPKKDAQFPPGQPVRVVQLTE
jgi:glutathionyl-hydroquinone reductase